VLKWMFPVLFLGTVCHSQTSGSMLKPSSHYFSAIVGYNGFGNNFVEAGLGLQRWSKGHHMEGSAWAATAELKTDGSIIGFKLGRWFYGMGMAFAGNTIVYIDGNEVKAGVRPEVGFSVGLLKVVYGLNLLLPDYSDGRINVNVFNAVVAIPLMDSK
jgi:hypothetical protein